MPLEVHPASEITDFYPVDDRRPEEKFGMYFAPYFELEVVDRRDNFLSAQAGVVRSQNRSFFDRRLVKDVEFEEDVESSDQIKITILNPELRLSNSTIFDLGNSFDLFMGYDNRPRMFMGRGIITEVSKDYNDTEPVIVVTGHDISYFMMEEQKADIVPDGSRWWQASRQAPQQPANAAIPAVVENAPRSIISIKRRPDDPNYPIMRGVRTDDTRRNMRDDPSRRGDNNAPALDLRAIERQANDRNMGSAWINRSRMSPRADERINPNQDVSTTHTVVARGPVTMQPQRFGRRRDAGHIWSGKTDSEIVAAIFQKYNVVPYVQLTNESRRVASRHADNKQDETDTSPRSSDISTPVSSDISTREPISIKTNIDDPTEPTMLGTRSSETRRYLRELLNRVDNNVPALNLNIPPLNSGRSNLPGRPRTIPSNEPQAEPAATESRRVVQRAGTTDWAFIQELAKKHGYICFTFFDYETRQWIGYWGLEENIPQSREYIFRYAAGPNTTLKTFRHSSSSRNQSTEIDLLFVDPITRRENRLRVNIQQGAEAPNIAENETENPDPIGTGPEVVLQVNGQRTMVNANHRFTSAEDAQRWLVAYWRRYAADFQVVEGETLIGIPELRAREYHIFDGVYRDSGRYFVLCTRHSMGDSNYTTSFTCRKTPTNVEDNAEVTVESEEMNRHEVDPTVDRPSNVA